MVLALAATGIVIFALLGEVMLPRIEQAVANHRARRRRLPQSAEFDLDPGRERRAEARARQLLKSCVNEEEWAMYRDLGFIRVWGMAAGRGERPAQEPLGQADDAELGQVDGRDDDRRQREWELLEGFRERGLRARRHRLSRRGSVREEPYAYLIYPHRPILAYVPQTGRLLNEYCVEFPDETRPYGSPRLPDSDDVLAKWMALTGDERRLIDSANMHLPGRQIDPRQVKRDLWRLRQWERERARAAATAAGGDRPPGGDGAGPERGSRVPLP